MAVVLDIPGAKAAVRVIEYPIAETKTPPTAFALLMPGTSIRPGPGADKAHKYQFETNVPSIYRTVAERLSAGASVPSIQLCWRHFPADGGTTMDAVHDMTAAIKYMRAKYGKQCGALMVGYSFGGAAILQFLAQCGAKPDVAANMFGTKHPWLLGCISLSGALKGQECLEPCLNFFEALKFLDGVQAPLLVVHGSEDDNVAISAAHKFFRRTSAYKSIAVVDGGDHNLREPEWRDLVADICSQWLEQVAVPRGSSSSNRSRAVQYAHHAGAAALCSIAKGSPILALAIEPTPQKHGGGSFQYREYQVPQPALESFACGVSEADAEIFAAKNARLLERNALHAERQRKARERASKERRGSFKEAHAKLAASRDKRRSLSVGASVVAASFACTPTASRGHDMFIREAQEVA